MDIKKCIKESFSVIGKEGSTNDGNYFIDDLWRQANGNFDEVKALAKLDENSKLIGVWGLMSDFTKSFNPWEDNFSRGLYLAGVEVIDNAEAPEGWTKWTVPAFEYIYTKVEDKMEDTFNDVLEYMKEKHIELAGAVFDYICPEENGQLYLFFPIKKL